VDVEAWVEAMSVSFLRDDFDEEPQPKESMAATDAYWLSLHDDANEQAVLGAMLLEPGATDLVLARAKPEYFYRHAHAHIMQAAVDLRAERKPIDLLTVGNALLRRPVPDILRPYRVDAPNLLAACGGPEYLTALLGCVPTTAHVNAYLLALAELYEKRITYAVQRGIYGDRTISDLMGRLEAVRDELAWHGGAKRIADFDVLESVEAHLGRREFDHANPHFDIPLLDQRSRGMPCPGYMVLMGDSGMGKTALALQIAHHWACGHGRPAVFFSLEMDARTQLIPRLAHMECGRGANSEEDLYRAAASIMCSPLILDDTTRGIEQIVSECRRLSREPSPRLVVVDYAGLVQTSRNMDERARLEHVSRELKALSKEVRATVVSLSQVTWDQERRDASTFGARGAEFDADMVVEVRRPGQTAFERRQSREAEVIIRKNRNGEVCSTRAAFMGVRFREYHGEETNANARQDGYWWNETGGE
jgi:replicative DNA helicase